MTPQNTSESDLLEMFAMAYKADQTALTQFLAKYPEHVEALVDFVHELDLQRELVRERSLTPEEEAWIDAATSRMSEGLARPTDPFAAWQSQNYVEARRALGVPSSVITAFRDRMVAVSTVPAGFLKQLANLLHVKLSELVSFLREPPRLAPSLSYKADEAPRAPGNKLDFDAILTQAGVTAEVRANLLNEDV